MRAIIKKEELYDSSIKIKEIALELEDLSHIFSSQIVEDVNFAGEMADAYQHYLQELMKEHYKIIQFYKDLSKEMQEIVKDYDDIDDKISAKLNSL